MYVKMDRNLSEKNELSKGCVWLNVKWTEKGERNGSKEHGGKNCEEVSRKISKRSGIMNLETAEVLLDWDAARNKSELN